ncbi:MAG: DHH family phosphoesterase [Candidatus Pacearchaeota archaeon]
MLKEIKSSVEKFLKESHNKEIQVVSHFDTDGITSAAIIVKCFKKLNLKFHLKIIKNLDKETISELSKDKLTIFLDLASNSFNYLKEFNSQIFILDHHEIISDIPKNITMINPRFFGEEEISSAGICYLFAKEIDETNKDLAYLAVIGMVGDMLEKNIGKTYNIILKESDVIIKKGLLLYPATRPLDRVLEYNSLVYIPKVTGSNIGACNFLRDIGIQKENGKYKTILELDKEETSKLLTAITLNRIDSGKSDDLIGNIYLINFLNKLEDAREISVMINACSRNGDPGMAVSFCLQNKKAKDYAEKIYAHNKQNIIKALNIIPELKKIEDKNYLIINAEDKIKDTIIGTVASILSNSKIYNEGKAIIALAYNQDKIKVSARMVGKSGKNIREVLNSVVEIIGGEVGGHPFAAGCLIKKEKESEFIQELKKKLEIELVKL